MSSIPRADPLRRALVALVLAWLPFAIWPGLDLWTSGLFYDASSGRFPLIRLTVLEDVRNGIWWLSIIMFVAVACGLVLALARSRGRVPARVWAVALGTYLLGPVLLVNVVLKEWWGRARPADVVQFGGDRLFTPPAQIADQCAQNCSFVSGEGAGAAALAVAVFVLMPALPRRWRRPAMAVTVVLAGVATFLRLATGRHFLSDSVLAVLMVVAIAAALWRFLPADWRPGDALR